MYSGASSHRCDCGIWHTYLNNRPGYEPSPLVSLPNLAAAMGVTSVQVKCEGGRFGIGSFKALGAPYALANLLRATSHASHSLCPSSSSTGGDKASGSSSHAGGGGGIGDLTSSAPNETVATAGSPTEHELRTSPTHRAVASQRTFSTASDGNHGVAVAWAARRFGAHARVYDTHSIWRTSGMICLSSQACNKSLGGPFEVPSRARIAYLTGEITNTSRHRFFLAGLRCNTRC
jgi:hypothetical protein